MRSHVRAIQRLTSLCSVLAAHLFRYSGAGTAEPDIILLQDLRRKIERSDRSVLSGISSRPKLYSGTCDPAGDRSVSPESFLQGCITAAKKDIDEILQAETGEEL